MVRNGSNGLQLVKRFTIRILSDRLRCKLFNYSALLAFVDAERQEHFLVPAETILAVVVGPFTAMISSVTKQHLFHFRFEALL